MLTEAYLAKIARSVGILPFWMEDAVQEMLIKLWRAGDECEYPILVARTAAIDFHRKNSHYNRRKGHSPDVHCFTAIEARTEEAGVSLLDRFTAREMPIDDVIDCRDSLARLGIRDQRILLGLGRGDTMRQIAEREGLSESFICQQARRARKKMRAA